ncbi:MAG: hypothetical protein ACR2NP_17100, partial [Pirellulaceae bacterium]
QVSGTMVMLNDGSVIRCEAGESSFVVASTPGVSIPQEQIVGFWGANRVAMYPSVAAEMFDGDKAVMTSPLYDIILTAPVVDFPLATTAVDLDDAEVFGQIESRAAELAGDKNKLVEMLAAQRVDDVDAVSVADTPPIWFSPPAQREEGTGLIRTYAGEEYVLNGSAGFTLQDRTNRGLTIAIGENSIEIPKSDIRVFQMPADR